MRRWAVGFVVGCVVFIGCGPSDGEVDDVGWHGYGNMVSARLIVVDGVQCVVMDGYEMGGIDCDWSDE